MKLNNKQKEVIENFDDNILVVAPPGSGKTRTIVEKIIYQLTKQSIDINKIIIAITFTNRAAEEMLERIENSCDDISKLFVGTIHSFCLEYIFKKRYETISCFSKGYRIISPEEESKRLVNIAKELKLSKEEVKDISYKNINVKINKSGKFITKNQNHCRVLEKYYSELKKDGLLNFELLLYYSFEILLNNPVLTKTLKKSIESIYVDEYQDTHQIQYDILSEIYKAENIKQQIIFVGDVNQAIYESLGSIIKTCSELESEFNTKFVEHKLVLCYRSPQKIIDFYQLFSTSENNVKSIQKDDQFYEILALIADQEVIYSDIATKISELLKNGVKEHNICIMSPWWYLVNPSANRLKELLPDIKFDSVEVAPIKRNEELPLYILSKVICMIASKNNIKYKRKLSSKIIYMFNEYYREKLDIIIDEFLSVIEVRRKKYDSGLGTDYLRNEMKYFLFDYLNIKSQTVKHDFDIFMDEVVQRVNDFKHKIKNEISTFTNVFNKREGIVVSSCHGVKGEEYEYIFCLDVNEGKIPHFKSLDDRLSAKRLLYVMFSRAKKGIYIYSLDDNRNGITKEVYEAVKEIKARN